MHTVNEIVVRAPVQVCFRTGADVEAWPDVLPHYRWVRFTRKAGFGAGRVEMAARRDFGPIGYPVWWVSEMSTDASRPAVVYRHVEGITTGMDVVWSFSEIDPETTRIRIDHRWDGGPPWPLPAGLRTAIADLVIGPIFIHQVAGRTLAGIRDRAERLHAGQARIES